MYFEGQQVPGPLCASGCSGKDDSSFISYEKVNASPPTASSHAVCRLQHKSNMVLRNCHGGGVLGFDLAK